MKKLLLTLALSVCAVAAVPALAQQKSKPAMDHSVYDNWKNLTRIRSVYNSNLFYYSVNPQEETLFLLSTMQKQVKNRDLTDFIHLISL